MSRHLHGYPWFSPTSRLYRPLLLAGPQGHISYRHRAVVCRFYLVIMILPFSCEGVHSSMSLMSLSLFLQKCPTCLVHLTWIVFVIGGKWQYSCCFVGCCLQDLINTTRNIAVMFLSSFFSLRLVSVHVVHPYSSVDTTAAWKKLRFILSVRSDFHMTDSLLIAVHDFC